MTHTPGPWNVNGPNLVEVPDSLAIEISMRCGDTDGTEDQYFANARLIAAAPDLLEALDALVETIEVSDQKNPSIQAIVADIFFQDARAAIAKAKGSDQ